MTDENATNTRDFAGIEVRPLRRIADERGCILHMRRDDDEAFTRFGEIYFSTIYPGVVKGWHRHRRMTLNYAVPVGMIKLVCYDDRPGSPTKGRITELHLGEHSYSLVTIPPMIWNGFACEGPSTALVANCSTTHHDPEEIERLDPHGDVIPYDWARRDG